MALIKYYVAFNGTGHEIFAHTIKINFVLMENSCAVALYILGILVKINFNLFLDNILLLQRMV